MDTGSMGSYTPPEKLVEVKDGKPTLNTDSVGVVAGAEPQPDAEIIVKRVLAGAVAVAGVLVTVLPENTIGYKVAFGIVALGAALGITSRGVQPKK